MSIFAYPSISYHEQRLVLEMVNLFVTIIIVASCVTALVFYILQAVGLYRMSKNRGYQYPWLAFIPVASGYVLGGIADNINVCYGRRSNWRVWLAILSGVSLASTVLSALLSINWLYNMLETVFSGYFDEYYLINSMVSYYGPLFLLLMLGSLVGLGYMVVSAICLLSLIHI